jgi:uncharacterized protein YqcC (DUF446 family)
MTDLKATIARLLDILDQVEREIRRLDLWLNKHPVDAREHMDPVSYLQFYFLPEQRETLKKGILPRNSVVPFNAPYDFKDTPEKHPLMNLLIEYGHLVKAGQ